MFNWINNSKLLYTFSNLLVLPAVVIPRIDFLANLSFLSSFLLLFNTNKLLLLALCGVFIIKNNSNYRFNLLLKLKGEEVSKSDYETVYLYAWCTLLRYLLIGVAVKHVFIFFK